MTAILSCSATFRYERVQTGASPRVYVSPTSLNVDKKRTPYPYYHSQRWAISLPIRQRGMHHPRVPGHPTRSTHCTILLHNSRSARHAPQGRMHQTRPTPGTGQSYERDPLSDTSKTLCVGFTHCTCAPNWLRGWEHDWPHQFSFS